MALSHGLAQAGNAPDELKTSATVTFQPGEGITKIALTVEGVVPGIDEAAFREAAEREGELPGVEGARRRPGDHARRAARGLTAARPRPLGDARRDTKPTRR